MKLFYVPAIKTNKNKDAEVNFGCSVLTRTARDGTPLSQIPALVALAGREVFGLWGFSTGTGGSNIPQYNKITPGDVLFFRSKAEDKCQTFDGFGYLSHKAVDPDISRAVWGSPVYENLVVIDRYIRFEKPFRLVTGTSKNNMVVAHLGGVPDCVWHDGYNMFRQWDLEKRQRDASIDEKDWINEENLIDRFLSQLDYWEVYSDPAFGAVEEDGALQEEDEALRGDDDSPTERNQMTRVRTKQGPFRRDLLDKFNQCRLCDIDDKRLLLASHIKPWKVSTEGERRDVNNGLLLCPQHDAVFDKGLITFLESGEIVISNTLRPDLYPSLNIHQNISVRLNKKQEEYMSWHRTKVFKA